MSTEPSAIPGEAPARRARSAAIRRAARWLGVVLLVLDYGSLSFLLWSLDMDWRAALPLGVAVGALTTYGLQWRYMLSPGAYRAAGSKGRFVAAAAVIVGVNLGASSLLVLRYWYTYLFVRVLAAAIGLYAWARWQVIFKLAPRITTPRP